MRVALMDKDGRVANVISVADLDSAAALYPEFAGGEVVKGGNPCSPGDVFDGRVFLDPRAAEKAAARAAAARAAIVEAVATKSQIEAAATATGVDYSAELAAADEAIAVAVKTEAAKAVK